MYRIILILALFTVLYFLLRSAIRELRERRSAGSHSANQISDKNQMIQDPNCRVFVPKGVAVREEIGGRRLLLLQPRVREDVSETTRRLTA